MCLNRGLDSGNHTNPRGNEIGDHMSATAQLHQDKWYAYDTDMSKGDMLTGSLANAVAYQRSYVG